MRDAPVVSILIPPQDAVTSVPGTNVVEVDPNVELWCFVSLIANSAMGAGTGVTIGAAIRNTNGLYFPMDNNGFAKGLAADIQLKSATAEQPFLTLIEFFGEFPCGLMGFVNTGASIVEARITTVPRKIVGR